MSTHPVITKTYPENLHGGIMICGINFGYSAEDERSDAQGTVQETEPLSFFSDTTVNTTKFKSRILGWLESWGIHLQSQPGKEGPLERAFWQTNWSNTQTRSVTSHEKITRKTLLQDSHGILSLIEQRRPSIILFIGRDLIEVLNDITIRDRVESILGPRPGNGTVVRSKVASKSGIRYKMVFQSFEHTLVICLPHTSTRGLTNEQVASFELPTEFKKRISEQYMQRTSPSNTA